MKLFISILIFVIGIPLFSQTAYNVKYLKADEKFSERPIPNSEFWKNITNQKINLTAQQMALPHLKETTVPGVSFRSFHDGEKIYVLLEWEDPTLDASLETEKMSDACAIQFPVNDMSKTPAFMGGKGAPVVIAQWKAVWQNDVEKGFARIKDIYPNTWVENTDKFGQNTALLSKNHASNDERKSPVQLAVAEGFGSLALQYPIGLRAWGEYERKIWKVVFAVKMKSGQLNLEKNKKTGISFAIWEGGKGNTGSRKNILMSWQPILLEAEK